MSLVEFNRKSIVEYRKSSFLYKKTSRSNGTRGKISRGTTLIPLGFEISNRGTLLQDNGFLRPNLLCALSVWWLRCDFGCLLPGFHHLPDSLLTTYYSPSKPFSTGKNQFFYYIQCLWTGQPDLSQVFAKQLGFLLK